MGFYESSPILKYNYSFIVTFPYILFFQGVLSFHLEESLPWSILFARVNLLQRRFAFEHAFVSDSNLEQIFIEFARAKKREDDLQQATPGGTATVSQEQLQNEVEL